MESYSPGLISITVPEHVCVPTVWRRALQGCKDVIVTNCLLNCWSRQEIMLFPLISPTLWDSFEQTNSLLITRNILFVSVSMFCSCEWQLLTINPKVNIIPFFQMFAYSVGWSGVAEGWCRGPPACPRFSHLMKFGQRQRLPNTADPKQHGTPTPQR